MKSWKVTAQLNMDASKEFTIMTVEEVKDHESV